MPDKHTARPDAALPRGEAAALERRARQAQALRDNLARRKAQARQRRAGESAKGEGATGVDATEDMAAERGAAADIARPPRGNPIGMPTRIVVPATASTASST